jgi:UPF0716 protein FxsA
MWKWMLVLLITAFVAAEVAVLLVFGGWLGVGWTLAWMVASSVLGLVLVRRAGLQALVRIHRKLCDQELPTEELMDMAMILVGGFMLIAPGFLSDALGLLLLLPPVRWLLRALFRALFGEFLPEAGPAQWPGAPNDEVIEIRAGD